jgi:hypothetical protein
VPKNTSLGYFVVVGLLVQHSLSTFKLLLLHSYLKSAVLIRRDLCNSITTYIQQRVVEYAPK